MAEWLDEFFPQGKRSLAAPATELNAIRFANTDDAAEKAKHCQQTQRPKHHGRRFVGEPCRLRSLRTKEHDVKQAEHVERSQHGDKHSDGEQGIALPMQR